MHIGSRSPQLTRRTLLAAGLATASGLAGCAPSAPAVTSVPAATYQDLVAADPFYVAHRGGGRNWPEMTGYAYQQAAALAYVKAIEISVCVTADGVLACSHDANTKRVTGADHEIAATDWATLSSLMVTAAETDDPSQPARPFTRFEDVITAHLDNLVCFVEPKTHVTNEPLLARMTSAVQPERVVWKQPINSVMFSRAKQVGFATWGYVLNEPAHLSKLDEFAADPHIDMLGVGVTESDDVVRRVLQLAKLNGKGVMMWPIITSADQATARDHGAQGLMTSDIVNVPSR